MADQYDVIIIGAGPGGYTAAASWEVPVSTRAAFRRKPCCRHPPFTEI